MFQIFLLWLVVPQNLLNQINDIVLTYNQKIIKRSFDVVLATVVLFSIWWFILLLVIISYIDTKKSGILIQKRIGYKGLPFYIYKIRTMSFSSVQDQTTITTIRDKRITRTGRLLRRYKLDELPQIVNVIIGNMSLVGPRPDVEGYADKLEGAARVILSVKPGVTGPASIYFKNEESLLETQKDPKLYNDTVIWPKKIEINKAYVENYSLLKDIKYLCNTVN